MIQQCAVLVPENIKFMVMPMLGSKQLLVLIVVKSCSPKIYVFEDIVPSLNFNLSPVEKSSPALPELL